MNKSKELIKIAKSYLGKPYKYAAGPKEAPTVFDCSSFVQYLYKKIGIKLPRTALEQASIGKKIKKNQELKIGDLVFIKGSWCHYNPEFPQGIGHVVMFIGDGKVINAKYNKKDQGGSVIIEPLENYLNRKDLIIIKRVLNE